MEATTVYLLPIYLAGNYLPIYLLSPINVHIYMIINIKKSEHILSSLAISNLNIHQDSMHRRLHHHSKDLKISRGIFFLASAPHIISYALVEPDPRRPNCLDADMSLLFLRLSFSSYLSSPYFFHSYISQEETYLFLTLTISLPPPFHSPSRPICHLPLPPTSTQHPPTCSPPPEIGPLRSC